jgi:hypothetical protein
LLRVDAYDVVDVAIVAAVLLILLPLMPSLLATTFAPAASASYANDVAVAPIGDDVATTRGCNFHSTPETCT